MKRKSESLYTNVRRKINRNKTLGRSVSIIKLKDLSSHKCSEPIVSLFLKEFISNLQQEINSLARQEFINGFITHCQTMGESLRSLQCPEISDEGDVSIFIDQEAERVPYDPICGFDKLVTKKNELPQKILMENSFVSTKNKNFGRMVQKKNSIKENEGGKLVPLDNRKFPETNEEKQQEKEEVFVREKILNPLMFPSILVLENKRNENRKSVKQGKELLNKENQIMKGKNILKKDEEFILFYNDGSEEKENYLHHKETQNNVIQTTWKVLDHLNNDNKQKYHFDIKTNTKFEQIIKNPYSRNLSLIETDFFIKYQSSPEANQQEIIKKLLSSFTQKEVTIKSKQPQTRLSKIL